MYVRFHVMAVIAVLVAVVSNSSNNGALGFFPVHYSLLYANMQHTTTSDAPELSGTTVDFVKTVYVLCC